MDISIIIPVYFNEGSIEKTYLLLEKEIFSVFPKLDFEVIFVDDGSRDKSYQEIINVKEKNNNIRVIQFTRNFGKEAALEAGLKECSHNVIVTIDCDLQHPIDLIPKMI